MGVELERPTHPNDDWRISWNGRSVVAFAGPEAQERAEQCYRELITRLGPIGRAGSKNAGEPSPEHVSSRKAS